MKDVPLSSRTRPLFRLPSSGSSALVPRHRIPCSRPLSRALSSPHTDPASPAVHRADVARRTRVQGRCGRTRSPWPSSPSRAPWACASAPPTPHARPPRPCSAPAGEEAACLPAPSRAAAPCQAPRPLHLGQGQARPRPQLRPARGRPAPLPVRGARVSWECV